MDVKRPKLYGSRSKISRNNSEFDFDDIKETKESSTAPVPSLFWSDRYKKQTSLHDYCSNDTRKRKLPLKDNMNKIPKINHLDEICNRAARGKLFNKNKGKIKSQIGSTAKSGFDFDCDDLEDDGRVTRAPVPSKRPLKAESPSKHRKLVSSSFDFPTEEKELKIKEKTQNIFKPGPKKAKLNMKAIRPTQSNGNGRLGGIFDIPGPDGDCEENIIPGIEIMEIEPVGNEDEEKMMVSNVKDSGNCIRDGESQKFFDEFDYLFDGMKKSEPIAVRSLSTFNVTKNCFNKEFRANIRKNNLLKTIYKELEDAEHDPSLSLCAAAFLYVISIDDKHFDFSKQAIEILLTILKTEEDRIFKAKATPDKRPSKSLTNFRKKISELFRKELTTVEFIDLENIRALDLVHEVLIFLTAPTAEVDFREFIRIHGGIDFFMLNIEHLLHKMDKSCKPTNENCQKFIKIERSLQMLENLTYMNSDNQNYALNFKNKVIVKCLYGTLKSAMSVIHNSKSNKIKLLTKSKNVDNVFDCLFATMRMMLNLTHGNEYCCTEIGNYSGMIDIILENVLFLPSMSGEKHKLDCYTLGLGLLINLIGEVPENRTKIGGCSFDSSPWFDASDEALLAQLEKSPVELLVSAFLKFHTSSQELEKQTFSEAESLCMKEGEEPDAAAVKLADDDEELKKRESNSACSAATKAQDNGDDPFGYDESADDKTAKPKDNKEKNTIKVKKVVDNMIAKAGEHMEESMIGSYFALLLGILTKDEDNLELIKKLIPEPKVLIEVLKKFLQFMNMMSLTSAAASKSGMQQIRSIVHWLSAVL